MKRILSILCFTVLILQPAFSVTNTQAVIDDDFNNFMNGSLSEFDSFLNTANRDFIEFMRNPWVTFEAREPIEMRVEPEPEKQPMVSPEEIPASKPPRGEVETDKKHSGQSDFSETKKQSKIFEKLVSERNDEALDRFIQSISEEEGIRVEFAGVSYCVSDALNGKVPEVATNENSIANAYETLLRSDWQPLVAKLRQLRQSGLNNDWALYLFVKDVSEKFANGNSAIVLRQFLLNQLGYRARVAIVSSEKRLALYYASKTPLYGAVYLNIDGATYYDVDSKKPCSLRMCSKEAPMAENLIDMQIDKLPQFGGSKRSFTRTGKEESATVSVTLEVPEELARFYAKIPLCDYSIYASSTPDREFANSLVSSLKKSVRGMNKKDTASLLLDFVQRGFEYATDETQFGHEKPFFIEELFYYPQCDCEDRSVFYSYLIKNLLNLDVILLIYPNHMATAVDFGETPTGDFVTVNGKYYTICDPTFIGASIGMGMPQYKNVTPKTIILSNQ